MIPDRNGCNFAGKYNDILKLIISGYKKKMKLGIISLL
jgi:hypothetical protein